MTLRNIITFGPAIALALFLGITAAQAPAKLAHTVNTADAWVVQW